MLLKFDPFLGNVPNQVGFCSVTDFYPIQHLTCTQQTDLREYSLPVSQVSPCAQVRCWTGQKSAMEQKPTWLGRLPRKGTVFNAVKVYDLARYTHLSMQQAQQIHGRHIQYYNTDINICTLALIC